MLAKYDQEGSAGVSQHKKKSMSYLFVFHVGREMWCKGGEQCYSGRLGGKKKKEVKMSLFCSLLTTM